MRRIIDYIIRLEKDGNIGILFIEMSADQVVRKLKVICKESRQIWKAFDSNFDYDFFFDVLAFGYSPNETLLHE